jgi:hypothetical protein
LIPHTVIPVPGSSVGTGEGQKSQHQKSQPNEEKLQNNVVDVIMRYLLYRLSSIFSLRCIFNI